MFAHITKVSKKLQTEPIIFFPEEEDLVRALKSAFKDEKNASTINLVDTKGQKVSKKELMKFFKSLPEESIDPSNEPETTNYKHSHYDYSSKEKINYKDPSLLSKYYNKLNMGKLLPLAVEAVNG